MATNNSINLQKPITAFQAGNTASQTSVTGDGTIYTVSCNNEIYDNDNSFDGTTFTAPSEGLYVIFGKMPMYRATAAAIADNKIYLIADGITYIISENQVLTGEWNAFFYAPKSFTILCYMTASSTAKFYIQSSGGTKDIDIYISSKNLFGAYKLTGID